MEAQLNPGETLLCQSKPAVLRLGGAYRVIAAFGWLSLLICAFFLAIGLANLDEMEGAFGIWITFVGLSAALFVAFALFAPFWGKRLARRVRYGVSEGRALILQGHGGMLRLKIAAKGKIERVDRGKHGWEVLFHYPKPRTVVDAKGQRRTIRPRPTGFHGLTEEDAKQAEAALAAIRGRP
ncbi:hypothetical protein DYI42_19345 [Vannielia litorea]|nr:hypothetical protein [Vannielia litorea]